MGFFVERQRNPGKSKWRKTTPGAEVCGVEAYSRTAGERENTSDSRDQSTGGRGSLPPRKARGQYRAQSPRTSGARNQAEERPELRVEERIFVGDQLNSAEIQPLVCLLEAQGKGLLRSAREGDELRTGTNMRALLSALASGRAEIDNIG